MNYMRLKVLKAVFSKAPCVALQQLLHTHSSNTALHANFVRTMDWKIRTRTHTYTHAPLSVAHLTAI